MPGQSFPKVPVECAVRGPNIRGMEPSPQFSIILPTFNRAGLVERALASVVAQSEPDWELLVADDGSTDDTWSRLAQWRGRDRRIRCWRHPNRGQAASRNRMLELARGQWIAFLDSDDELHPSHLSVRRQAIEAQPWIDLWLSPMRVVGSPLVPCMVDEGRMIHVDRCVGVGMLLVRREAMLAIGGFPDVRYAEESALLQRFVASGISSARLGARTYIYHRDHGSSLTLDRERQQCVLATRPLAVRAVAHERHDIAL